MSCGAAKVAEVVNLQTDYRVNPVGIDDPVPPDMKRFPILVKPMKQSGVCRIKMNAHEGDLVTLRYGEALNTEKLAGIERMELGSGTYNFAN